MANIHPTWSAPANIAALTTTKIGGISQPPFDSNNMGLHVNDNQAHVLANRSALHTSLNLPGPIEWLDQTHSTDCVIVEQDSRRQADAAITRDKQRVLAIMTADCQPILLCNRQGTEIAAIHAGWRGLLNGIIEKTIAKMNSSPDEIMAWIGPSICQNCFEVGDEVREQFFSHYVFSKEYFKPHGKKWLANTAGISEKILNTLSIHQITLSHLCTFERKNEFYSYRREQQTGRMASLIWFLN